jgi:glutamyl-tRNA reductase
MACLADWNLDSWRRSDPWTDKSICTSLQKSGHHWKKLDTAFSKANTSRQEVRSETEVNRGAVSIGSAAVDLAKWCLGDWREK